MNVTTAIVLPSLIGMIAGLRTFTAPAAITLAARAIGGASLIVAARR